MRLGVLDKRDLSLEVSQRELESLNARFVWVPELEKEDLVGLVAEHAARAGVRSIAIPAYWIFKEGSGWRPEREGARGDEKVMLYFHGGGFVVSFSSFEPYPRTYSHFRLGLPIRLIQRRRFLRDPSNILRRFREYFRSTTASVPGLHSNPKIHSHVRSSTGSRHTSISSVMWDFCQRISP
jgi:hypothetical protein